MATPMTASGRRQFAPPPHLADRLVVLIDLDGCARWHRAVDLDYCRRLKNLPAFRRLYRASVDARSYVATLESCLTYIPDPP
jgi:hypothetical protein